MTVDTAVEDGLAIITLNRPDRLNAIDAAVAEAWSRAAVDAVAEPGVRAILLEGRGPAFCAGGDVVAMARAGLDGAAVTELARTLNRGILALDAAAVPVVVAAHGTTAGGGLGLLLCGDHVVVGANSRLGSRYADVGLTPDLSVTARLAHAVGQQRALSLLMTDRMLTARDAVDWGLASEAVDGDDAAHIALSVGRRAREVARAWIEGASAAYGQARRLVRDARDASLAEQLEREAVSIGEAFATPQARARIAAFAARSPGHSRT